MSLSWQSHRRPSPIPVSIEGKYKQKVLELPILPQISEEELSPKHRKNRHQSNPPFLNTQAKTVFSVF